MYARGLTVAHRNTRHGAPTPACTHSVTGFERVWRRDMRHNVESSGVHERARAASRASCACGAATHVESSAVRERVRAVSRASRPCGAATDVESSAVRERVRAASRASRACGAATRHAPRATRHLSRSSTLAAGTPLALSALRYRQGSFPALPRWLSSQSPGELRGASVCTSCCLAARLESDVSPLEEVRRKRRDGNATAVVLGSLEDVQQVLRVADVVGLGGFEEVKE